MSRYSIITKICEFLDRKFPSPFDWEASEIRMLEADEETIRNLEKIIAESQKKLEC